MPDHAPRRARAAPDVALREPWANVLGACHAGSRVVLATTLASTLLRCPRCATARAARELVLADGFWVQLCWTVTPFVIVALIVGAIVRRVDRTVP
jgi:hypothetical protein